MSKKDVPIAIIFPCNEEINKSDQLLFNTISIVDHYIGNLQDFLIEKIDEAEANFYGETVDQMNEQYELLANNLFGSLFIDIILPYRKKYPTRNLIPRIHLSHDDLYDTETCSDDELGMRILELLADIISFVDGMSEFGFFLNVMFDAIKKDLPDAMWTHRKMNPYNFVKYSLFVYCRFRNYEEGYRPGIPKGE